MPSLIIASFLLGIAFCAPPGVVTAESIRRGLARGFRPALAVQLGSLIGDATWALVALVGIAFLVEIPLVRLLVGLAGVVFLLRLAWSALADARRGEMPDAGAQKRQGDFVIGALLSLSNPYAIAFWLGVGTSALTTIVAIPGFADYTAFFLAFMAGATLYCFLMAGLIAWGRRFVNARFFQAVNLLCGGFLAWFAVQLLWNLVQSDLPF
ncbi:MAG: LysE family transporter [Chloroflexi bacterium]|nr:LysE family transporter [Chloroflexota bacterium]